MRSEYRPSVIVRILFAGMGIGFFAFMVTLFVGAVGVWGLIVPLGIVVIIVAGQYLTRTPWRMAINPGMANGFLLLGVIGLAASVLSLVRWPFDRAVMEPAPLIVFGVAMTFSIALGLAARKDISKQ